jgi:hypothetical protein
MVTLSYHIRTSGNEAFDAQTRCLLVEAGNANLTILLWDKVLQKPAALELFTNITDWNDQWEHMLQQSELLNYKSIEATVLFNTFRCMPIPNVFFDAGSAKAQMKAVFGEKGQIYDGADVFAEQNMVVSWQVPLEIYRKITGHFLVVKTQSLGAALIQSGWNAEAKSPYGKLVVTGENAWLVLWRAKQLLLLKAISILNPDDLAYEMLNACKQWGIENSQVYWEVSGMVNMDAPLWQSPDRFFEHFEPADGGDAIGPEIPGHFFAHLVNYMRYLAR